MRTIAILGSRNPEGQTAQATEALLQAMEAEGWDAERVFLTHGEIERCRQCDQRGWGLCRSEGRCEIEDDFAPLVEKIKEANVVIFANPVYFSDLSESMRAFLDRLRRTCMHEAGKAGIEGKAAVGICVAGGGGGGAPECTVHLEKVLKRCGFDVVDMIPARRQNLEMKREVLHITGQWLAGYTP